MRFKITHITTYRYSARVSHCYNLAHIIPRPTDRQRCINSFIHVKPTDSLINRREDYFGNIACHLEVQRPHTELTITATSEIDTAAQRLVKPLDQGVTCADALVQLQQSTDPELLEAKEFLLASPMVPLSDTLRDYAAPSFALDRPLLECVMALTTRIFKEFKYSPTATNIATPLDEVFEKRHGVCQDFAHVQIACLRALGYPARYVSGYIETLPPPGQEKMVGSDATHAWIAVYSPSEGWFEFDPTNNSMAGEQHVITAWGRDYFDVTPLKGVIFGGGDAPILEVSVDVARTK